MYSYEWDEETGGYLLISKPSSFSKEPRPVYYKELDILGFNKYWTYKKDDSKPYMWAEANNYIYRGKPVAKTKGGSLYTAPEILLNEENSVIGQKLQFIDIDKMVEKNNTIMDSLVNETIKRVYNTYIVYKDKIDVFYVAFSGGKDSIALLDIVQRALPHDAFKVVFGDTGMEFSDTYHVVEKTEKYCLEKNIDFHIAKSELDVLKSWEDFGPPAQTLRWCCSVHKTTPQILTLRRILNKKDFTGMAFIGVRADESVSRSEYTYISLGEKHKGQYSCNPILEWNSAELFLYSFKNSLIFNEAYKKGNSRVGCLVCPMAAFKNEYMKSCSYQSEIEPYINIVKKCNGKDLSDNASVKQYLETGGWKARRNGRELIQRESKYEEVTKNGKIILTIKKSTTSWEQWIKTIGKLVVTTDGYTIVHRGNTYPFCIKNTDIGYIVEITDEIVRSNPTFSKLFKQVFRKAAFCVHCQECEADCKRGCITFTNNDVIISDECISCSECHKVDKGCLLYKSVMLPKGGKGMNKKMSLNCYSNHGPKMEWINSFFELKEKFKDEHTLGTNMFDFFKRFLRDAGLLERESITKLAYLIDEIGIDSPTSWGILLSNLSYTPQIQWYIKNIKLNEGYSRDSIVVMLDNYDVKEVAAKQMILAYKRILDTPLGAILGLGSYQSKSNKLLSITRRKWETPDPKVILYSLYKFAKACGDYYQFTLARLMNFSIDSDGVSPAEIFGLSREEMEQILNGLTVNFPDFIHASFTLGLDSITLRSDKTSEDVLEIFKEN